MRFIDYAILGGSFALLLYFILMFSYYALLPILGLAGLVFVARRMKRR